MKIINNFRLTSEDTDTMSPPFKRMREEHPKEWVFFWEFIHILIIIHNLLLVPCIFFYLLSYENYFRDPKTSETYGLVKVRPWTRLDLTINRDVLEKFLNSVLSKIIIKPGISLKALKKEYYSILQPMFIRELVEVCLFMSVDNVYNMFCISIDARSNEMYKNDSH